MNLLIMANYMNAQITNHRVDYRLVGFILGIILFMVSIYFWNMLDSTKTLISEPHRNNQLYLLLWGLHIPLPLSLIFIFLNYLGIVKNFQPIVILGPLFFLFSFAWLLKLILNWQWLNKKIRILTLLEIVISGSLVLTMLTGIIIVNSKPFDLSLLVGSWIRFT